MAFTYFLTMSFFTCCFFFSSRRRHTRSYGDWSSDVCSSDLEILGNAPVEREPLLGFCRIGELQCVADAVVALLEIGRASCRERVYISVGAGALKKKRRW